MSVRITAMSAAVAALAAASALALPGQAGAASGGQLQPKENLECGFTRSYVAESKGWGPYPHYKHCSGDGKPVLLLTHGNLGAEGNFCAPAHQADQASLLPMINDVYEVMWVEVVGQCGGVG
ncbi:hypothetical protein [Allokutzneria sp. NRRL B-24872]|uniref:hypothetical protein n=1 Tax=Allokutzneria sp. NRRL B-24872 TaxID=1137961 RepID=UPI001178807A|nr:hypothetical protein [Allokutzneria sp. NRRL B-24872]